MRTGSYDPVEAWQFALGRELAGIFAIEDWQVFDGSVRFRGTLLTDPDRALALLTERLAPYGYTPLLHRPGEVTLLRTRPGGPEGRGRGSLPQILLLVLTFLTTLYAGAQGGLINIDSWASLAKALGNPRWVLDGLPFSVALLSILGTHELGHYVTAKRNGIRVTLPYFIPSPFGLGTFGAIIKMRSPVTNRRALFDVAIAGPLAGLVLAVPALVLGLLSSRVISLDAVPKDDVALGPSLLTYWLIKGVIGSVPTGHTIQLSALAVAGWFGLYVTALNLVPVGQLDGGHIAYALFGRRHRAVAAGTVALLVAMGVLFQQFIWLFWAALSMALGLRHPPPLNDLTPLDPRRRVMGGLALVLLILLLAPAPFV